VGGVIGAQIGAAILAASAVGGGEVPAESGYATAFWVGAVAALIGAVTASLVAPWRRRARARPGARIERVPRSESG
jgi:hypothetical protein